MAKNELKKESLTQVRQKRKSFAKPLMTVVVIIAAGVLGYKAWKNPQLIEQAKEVFTFKKEVKEDVYQPQINQLQEQLADLQNELAVVRSTAENPDFSVMEKRIDDIEQISVNTIKSKADVATVLGLIGRMDNAEGRLNDLGKVTNDSALVLTAAMLVKDAGERGGMFVYEAEVLDALAAGNHRISKEVARLNEIAAVGVPTVAELQRGFAEIYALRYPEEEMVDNVVADNWKDRIYHQLHKVVKIKKSGEEKTETAEPVFSEEDRAWNVIKDFVLEGDITKAMAIAQKPLNENVLKDKNFAEWLAKAQIYKDFYDSVARISANALAVMKVNFLRN